MSRRNAWYQTEEIAPDSGEGNPEGNDCKSELYERSQNLHHLMNGVDTSRRGLRKLVQPCL